MEAKPIGSLFLVGTPIGNLQDISVRALETLKSVDLIAAEDTRHTQKLLNHYEIKKPITSYFEYNKHIKGQSLINEIKNGKNIALVSDAGMPGISDPGSELVKQCIDEGLKISVIPGASAVLTGLVASGLDTAGFVFLGFFARGKKERKKLLAQMQEEPKTLVFYESPHRLVETLEDILETWGDRQCCVARELTKIHEEYKRGTLSQVLASYRDVPVIKGEITAVIAGKSPQAAAPPLWEELEHEVDRLVAQGQSKSEAIRETAKASGVSRRDLYNRLINKAGK